ncbi:MAG: hypothetical protein KIS78_00800 [Labilithrix sp.]|nr:hypothetical protein [Labilithrix sp.]
MGRLPHGRSRRRCHDPPTPPARSGRRGAPTPLLACAAWPRCIATYARVRSASGTALVLSAAQHLWLLLGGVAVSLGFGTRARTRRYGPARATSALDAGSRP